MANEILKESDATLPPILFFHILDLDHCKLHGLRTFLMTNIVVGFGVSLVMDSDVNLPLVKGDFHQGPRPKKIRN